MTTTFAPGDATAYLTPTSIAVVAAPHVDAELLARLLVADDTADARRALDGCCDAALVVTGDGRLHVSIVGDAVEVVADGHPIARPAGSPTAAWCHLDAELPSVVRVGRRGQVEAAARVPYVAEGGVVPISVVQRRLTTVATGATDPVAAAFGPTVDRSVEGAAIRPPVDAGRSVGVLVSADGRRVLLDRPALIGRRPAAATEAERTARLVRVDGAGVSRRHALVTDDRWSVVVCDLGSTNGTSIESVDGDRDEVDPEHPARLLPGAVLHLGGDTSFTLEATA